MGSRSSKPNPQNPKPEPEPEPGSIFTCEICIEPIDTAHKFRNGSGRRCSHPFCTDCVAKYISVKVFDDVASDVACPGPTCQLTLDPLTCRELVSRDTFTKWCDNLCHKAILGLDRCYCPNRRCSAMVVNECGGHVRKAKCPDCKRLFCFKCGVKWHAGYRCEESGEMRDQNDVVFGVLAERRKWMRCPRCYHCIELVEGCNIVKCRCGSDFCYKCGKKLDKHWCECNATMCRRFCLRFCSLLAVLLIIIICIICGTVSISREKQ